MGKSWKTFEERVRQLAALHWDRQAGPERIGGVDVDCVLKLDDAHYVLIEITEEYNLEKVRSDVVKLVSARNALSLTKNGAQATCICVLNRDKITNAMRDGGKEQQVYVQSIAFFERQFFDFPSYAQARQRVQFGSAVNPVSGVKDDSDYVPVRYLEGSREIDISSLASALLDQRPIVMTGEYGSGKSRCVRELFNMLALKSAETGCYPIAIDLKENWGLKRASEIVRRHFDDLGLDTAASNVLKGLAGPRFVFILDGFDEIGIQSWSDDQTKLRNTRNKSLEGVRDLIAKHGGGVFICGREHYFNNDEEMLSALGLVDRNPLIVRSKNEFTESEIAAYLKDIAEDYELPNWLPRRPLICQIIVSLAEDDLAEMLGVDGGDVTFWHKFIHLLCRRDTKINSALDPDAVFGMLLHLARTTRGKTANVGPISLSEIQKAFETLFGQLPDEQSAVMLQRLPGLGRVKAESNDRQFLDVFILDGLRAVDIHEAVARSESNLEGHAWANPLGPLGQKILAKKVSEQGTRKTLLTLARRCVASKNAVLASDIVATLVRLGEDEPHFGGLAIQDGTFSELDMTPAPVDLWLSSCTFNHLILCAQVPRDTKLTDCIAGQITGVSSAKGLPAWAGVHADHFENLGTVAGIKRSSLLPSQQILATIIRKTFLQKGSGRKEEALLRGLGTIGSKRLADQILKVMIADGLLRTVAGKEGTLYIPERAHTARMKKIMDELNTSKDPLWAAASGL